MINDKAGSDWEANVFVKGVSSTAGTASLDATSDMVGAAIGGVDEVNGDLEIGKAMVANQVGGSFVRGCAAVVPRGSAPFSTALYSPVVDALPGICCR